MERRYVSVELDYVLDENETAQDAADAISKGSSGYDITAIVEAEVGPGGHPLIRITGSRRAVVAFMEQNKYPLDEYQRELGDTPVAV